MQPATIDERRDLRRNNLPLPSERRPWIERFLRSKWTWIVLALLLVEAAALIAVGFQMVPDRPVPGGVTYGTGIEAVGPATKYALITVIPLSLLFLWADRFRPQSFWVWLITFGWGGTIAVWASFNINTFAAEYMSIVGPGDPRAASRAATFIAPFVEEAMKGVVLFLVAIVLRYRIVSKLSGIALGGLVGASFAFVENIYYYASTYRAASNTSGAGDPDERLAEIFQLRGILTFFGHPLFTSMIGIGIAVALRSKSKLVRVLAPVTGFLVAALLHMLFNGTASMGLPTNVQLLLLLFVAYPMVISLVIFTIRQLIVEKRLIRARLTDYARMGWLPDTDAHWASRLTTRVRVLWQALWEGRLLSTWRLQRALTELAYLRDSMARGLVDDGGMVREKELFARIRGLRQRGFVAPRERTSYPWTRRGRRTPDPTWAPPAQISQGDPRVPSGVPLGSGGTTYSPVDPRWAPPGT
ncbi:PrsW family intramembrane metalloprotease [Granulicoccus sp. GXG6511]|uniref:PrsW family intramembrane metalloprotease n=1 Tax=Granulicoccus sp. GXG6511 TaxID=3381351 RepID=UPI003D7EE997